MKQDKKLTLGMALLFLIIFVTFGVIIVLEKSSIYLVPQIEKKLISYLNETYPSIKNELKVQKTTYKNSVYQMKVISTKNKHLFFYIKYKDKKITDTYQEDYQKGKSLLPHISKKIEKEIKKKTNKQYKVTIPTTLNNFSTPIKNLLIKEENLEQLKIYNLEEELTTPSWTTQDISKTITTFITTLERNNITPKTYTLIINDQNDITKAVKINNITSEIIKNNLLNSTINDIITNKKDNAKLSGVTYKYLN